MNMRRIAALLNQGHSPSLYHLFVKQTGDRIKGLRKAIGDQLDLKPKNLRTSILWAYRPQRSKPGRLAHQRITNTLKGNLPLPTWIPPLYS